MTRLLVAIFTLVATALIAALPALGQTDAFPAPRKIMRIVIGVPAGGSLDAQARVVAEHLSRTMGVQAIVENRPGASLILATDLVAKAKPDGYTLLYTFDAFVQVPLTTTHAGYDPVKDFTPILLAGLSDLMLVSHQSIPASDVKDLIAQARANSGKLNCASIGTGTASHLFVELLKRQGGFDCPTVPYKGFSDIFNDLTEGRVQIFFAAAAGAIQFANTGRVRILASTRAKRSPLMPEVPTMEEQGMPEFSVGGWVGFFGPAKLPPDVLRALNAALVGALSTPRVRDVFQSSIVDVEASTPEAFGALVKQSYGRWETIINRVGMQKQ